MARGWRRKRRRAPEAPRWFWMVLGVAVLLFAVLVPLSMRQDRGRAVAAPPIQAPLTFGQRTHPIALWIGDSFTAGTGADNHSHDYAHLVCGSFGWICAIDAVGGTGYVNDDHKDDPTKKNAPQRLSAILRAHVADIVFVDAGRNDSYSTFPIAQVRAAADGFFQRLRAGKPKAVLVFVAPFELNTDKPPLGAGWTDFLQLEARKYNAHVISPMREGWIKMPLTGSMTIPDGHPDTQGHRYIADHLIADLRADGLGNVPLTDSLPATP